MYWAVDTFASLLPGHVVDADEIPADLWEQSLLFFNQMVSPWHAMLDPKKFDASVDAVAALGMTTVAGAHSAPLRGARLSEAFRLVRTLPHLPPPELPGQADLDTLIASRAAAAA